MNGNNNQCCTVMEQVLRYYLEKNTYNKLLSHYITNLKKNTDNPFNFSLNSAVAEEEDRQVSLAVELSLIESKVPPKVPPHQHLSTTSKSIPW
jgi:hypothetical protein